YTQSGPLFHAKTRALEKALTKSLPSHSLHLSYPTGPIHLNPTEIPGYNPPSSSSSSSAPTDSEDPPEPPAAYGWWRRKDLPNPENGNEDVAETPEIIYTGLQTSLTHLAATIKTEGPFDGVIGFSQGACAAALLASLLEPTRPSAFPTSPSPSPSTNTNTSEPFPPSFHTLHHQQPPLKFAILYSGFPAPGPRHAAFYNPPLVTPTLHFVGALDSVVEEGRSRGLVEVCEGARVVVHPGGHFLPCQRVWLDAAVGFVGECLRRVGGCGEGVGKGEGEEERVEDMEVPF
ncbi:MAG: hypothetical protein Q9182_005375, partial [Xanthomendoza sp. 2 TL-2023]